MFVRWIVAVLIGAVVAAVVGSSAWLLSPVPAGLFGVVFAVAALPYAPLLEWIIAVAPKTVPSSARSAETAEMTWMDPALAGTATDLVLVVGLGLAVISVARWELPTQLVLLGVLLVASASTATRYGMDRTRAVSA
jgi:hypothetical protein